jgi:hypothetical protein
LTNWIVTIVHCHPTRNLSLSIGFASARENTFLLGRSILIIPKELFPILLGPSESGLISVLVLEWQELQNLMECSG